MATCRRGSKVDSVAIVFPVIAGFLLLSVLFTVCRCGLFSIVLKNKARSFYAAGCAFHFK